LDPSPLTCSPQAASGRWSPGTASVRDAPGMLGAAGKDTEPMGQAIYANFNETVHGEGAVHLRYEVR